MAGKALVVIDMQYDFCPGGALAVAGGDEIIPVINRLISDHEHVILTQDWHPAGHSSFASSHPGKAPFEMVEMPYGPQTLWPDHCVQGTRGAELHDALDRTNAELVLHKGFHHEIDSYSAFYENDRTTPTGLVGYLRECGISEVVLCGLATDFCVAYSALDAAGHGFATTVILDACRGIDLNGSMAAMNEQMKAAGVTLV
ncbi:bifunctional nicotinamidase/pyrazinamidase [Rhizobium sp. TH2]|uniref:bifunctional nicotinamidase/pyrazinamidase n=1 Tax=Rhizobium sp. TH2 TaxID=2775403 RepID=UPI0021574327|nr:bifunctional nicotinamidase/pyrazinamidase [Rhizobium sp. TH2]UVC08066.1 bifunctional nicotinamidase/pyrazinamidase [Rhizobium sp. TH2]